MRGEPFEHGVAAASTGLRCESSLLRSAARRQMPGILRMLFRAWGVSERGTPHVIAGCAPSRLGALKSHVARFTRSTSGLLFLSAFNAVLDSPSIVFARRSRTICSTASAASAMRGWLWSSVKRFKQQPSK